MTSITGNKGEWSEFYVLLRTLSTGLMASGDGSSYPVLAVFDDSRNEPAEYRIRDERIDIIGKDGQIRSVAGRSEVAGIAKDVLDAIRAGSGAFAVVSAEKFMLQHGIKRPGSQGPGKTDIRIEIWDPPTKSNLTLGFSIKSFIGSKPTLFNASKNNTNFVYEVCDVSDIPAAVSSVNSIVTGSKYRHRVAKLSALGTRTTYYDVASGILALNLQVIESRLPEILAHLVLLYFSGFGSSIPELTALLEQSNPIGFDQSYGHPYYENKIKSFLRASALGMTASHLWTGQVETTGGYIIMDRSGTLTCVHTHDMNTFDEYLFRASLLDNPGGGRHEYGEAYECSGRLMFKLPLHVRFKS